MKRSTCMVRRGSPDIPLVSKGEAAFAGAGVDQAEEFEGFPRQKSSLRKMDFMLSTRIPQLFR